MRKFNNFEVPAGFIAQEEQQQMEGPDPALATATALKASEFIEKSRAAFTKMVTALNTLNVHEHLKPAVKGLTDQMNGLLAKLPPLEAHKAATDSSYAFNSLAYATNACQDALERATDTVSQLSRDCTTSMNAKDASLNGLVETAVQVEITKRVTEGKLFDKATVDGLVQTARNQAKETALNGIQVVSTRKAKLTELKLPLPENDSYLDGDDAAFLTLTATATNRVAKLKEKGLTLNSAPTLVPRLVYSSSFDVELKNILEALSASGKTTPEKTVNGDKKAKVW